MDSIQLSTLAALAGKWQTEADCGAGSADRRAALRECADTVRMLCEVRFEDCPHAAPHRYCAECPVSPCPIALGEHAVAKRGAVPEGWQLDGSEVALLHHLTSPDDDGEHSPITLRAGNVRMDDGTVKFGLLCEYTDYPDEGATLLVEGHPFTPAPAPANVSMPEPVAYGVGNTAITGHTNRLMMVRLDVPGDDQYAGAGWHPLVLADEARAYGERCRASGEAAEYARGLAEAGRLISLWLKDPDVQRMLEFARDASRKVTSWPDRLNGEAKHALRGEVQS